MPPIESPLSPAVAIIFMTEFETKALQSTKFKPKRWLRYVDDTFVIWTHGKRQLDIFLEELNNIHPKIKFTMEIEKDNKLPFLDVLVYKKSNGTLGHTVYRKPTHTNRYLNAESHHHPAQLKSVVKTLIKRSERLADNENYNTESKIIKEALQQNGYNEQFIKKATKQQKKSTTEKEKEEFKSVAYLPYVKGTTDRIGRILNKNNIRTIFKPSKKINNFLRNAKTHIPLENQGVYEIPCKACDQVYIGQTNRRIKVRRDEHINAVKKQEPASSLAQHVSLTSHTIDFENTRMITAIEKKTTRIIREAIEIEKRTNCMNTRDDAQRLPRIWKPVVCNNNNHNPRFQGHVRQRYPV